MDYVCSDCGYESDAPGNCPDCETPLLKREDGDVSEVEGVDKDHEEKWGLDDEDDEADEVW